MKTPDDYYYDPDSIENHRKWWKVVDGFCDILNRLELGRVRL